MLLTFNDAAVDPLWRGLNLELRQGEFLAVLGPNGVGKSTLIGTILGTRKLTHGSVKTDARVGYIPQQRIFDVPLRARDMVSLSAAHGVVSKRGPAKGDVDKLLARVALPESPIDASASSPAGSSSSSAKPRPLPRARNYCLPTNPSSALTPASRSARCPYLVN